MDVDQSVLLNAPDVRLRPRSKRGPIPKLEQVSCAECCPRDDLCFDTGAGLPIPKEEPIPMPTRMFVNWLSRERSALSLLYAGLIV